MTKSTSKQIPLRSRTQIFLAVSLIALVTIASSLLYIKHTDKCRSVPNQVSSLGTYNAPCEITVTIMQQGRQPNAMQDRAVLQKGLEGYKTTIRNDSLPDIGVYYVNVEAGKEDQLVNHLKSQPGISNATRQIECTKGCKGEIGPN